jgi:uncharacterized protein YceK
MKILIVLLIAFISGCSSFNKLTKEQVNEYCGHSKEHRDIIMLGLTDEVFQPHSMHIHCWSEYGFDEKVGIDEE